MRGLLLAAVLLAGCQGCFAHVGPLPAFDCPAACQHAEAVCPGSGDPCRGSCQRVAAGDPGYPSRVAAAGDCDAVSAAGR